MKITRLAVAFTASLLVASTTFATLSRIEARRLNEPATECANGASSAQSWNAFAIQQFNDEIARYMEIRGEAVARVGVPIVTSNPADVFKNEKALAMAIRKARPHAQAGDVFNDVVAFELRKRVHRVLKQHHLTATDLFTSFGMESPRHSAKLSVNAPFDWRFGEWMPPQIIDVLPEVPSPLQYRFVAGDLVLLDIDAGLILDVIPRALAEP